MCASSLFILQWWLKHLVFLSFIYLKFHSKVCKYEQQQLVAITNAHAETRNGNKLPEKWTLPWLKTEKPKKKNNFKKVEIWLRSVNVVMTIDPLFMSDTALCQGDTLWTVDNIPVIPLCRSVGQTLNLLNALILGVDGNWSSWGKPGPCDKTCGGGVRKIKRTCTNPPPSGDGKKCRGLSTKTKSCNTQQCKLVTVSVPPPFALTSYLPLLGCIVRPWLVKETRNNTNLRFF